MSWLNYHHLQYFWAVAREGSIAKACERLHVAQPTISAQLRKLELTLGHKLFRRSGRKLALTETGRVVYRYADEIFSLGEDLVAVLQGRMSGSPLRLRVGVADVTPKLLIQRLLAPVLSMPEGVQIVCYEGKPAELLARLVVHELDLVISDSPSTSEVGIRAYSHLLGETSVSFFAVEALARRHRRRFPMSLDGAPLLLPTTNTVMRRSLSVWFESVGVRPKVVAEFEDSALLKVFGQQSAGLFPGPTAIASHIRKQYGVQLVGEIPTVHERYYAISMERRVKHPVVLAIASTARHKIFD